MNKTNIIKAIVILIIAICISYASFSQIKVLTDDGTRISWQPLVTSGSTTLDQILGIDNTTTKIIDFAHNGINNYVRYITPNNFGTTYTGQGIAARFTETVTRFDNTNSSGRPNVVYTFGYNTNGGGAVAQAGDGALFNQMESHFESGGNLFEDHKIVVTRDGHYYRLHSFTINKDNGANTLYFTTNGIESRLPKTGTPAYWAVGDGTMDIHALRPGGSVEFRMHSEGYSGANFTYAPGGLFIRTPGDMHLNVDRYLTLPLYMKFSDDGAGWSGGNIKMDITKLNQNLEIHGTGDYVVKFKNDGYRNVVDIGGSLFIRGLNDGTGIARAVISRNGVLSLGTAPVTLQSKNTKKGVSGTFKNVKSITIVDGIITSIK